MSGGEGHGHRPGDDYSDEPPNYFPRFTAQELQYYAHWALQDPTQAPVPQYTQATQPPPQIMGPVAGVAAAAMGVPGGGNVPPPQAGRGGGSVHPYVVHYEQEQANLRAQASRPLIPPAPYPNPAYGPYPSASGPGRGYAAPPPGGSSAQGRGGYPAMGRGYAPPQGAAAQEPTVPVPVPPPYDPLNPSVEWEERNGNWWTIRVNEWKYGSWTSDQELQLKVIGASFVNWTEAKDLGQVLPGRRETKACRYKWRAMMRGRFWTYEEDEEFLLFRDYYSERNNAERAQEWNTLVQRMEERGRTKPEVEGRMKLFMRKGRAMGRENLGTGHGIGAPQ